MIIDKSRIPARASIEQSLRASGSSDGKRLVIHLLNKLVNGFSYEELHMLRELTERYHPRFKEFEAEFYKILQSVVGGTLMPGYAPFLYNLDLEEAINLDLRREFLGDRAKDIKATDHWQASDLLGFPGDGDRLKLYSGQPPNGFITSLKDGLLEAVQESVGNELDKLMAQMSDLYVTPSGWLNSIFGFSVNSTWINAWLEDNSFSKGIDEYLLAVGSPNRVFPDTRSLRYLEVRLSVEEPLFIFRYPGYLSLLGSELDRLISKASRKRQHADLRARAAQNTSEQRQIGQGLRNRKEYNRQVKLVSSCPYCGGSLGGFAGNGCAELDHVYPVSLGGRSAVENTVFVCKDCNRKKRNQTLRRFIQKNQLDEASVYRNLDLLGKES